MTVVSARWPLSHTGQAKPFSLPVGCYAKHSPITILIRGSFRRGTHGNTLPIVAKLPECTGTEFPLLKCLRTH